MSDDILNAARKLSSSAPIQHATMHLMTQIWSLRRHGSGDDRLPIRLELIDITGLYDVLRRHVIAEHPYILQITRHLQAATCNLATETLALLLQVWRDDDLIDEDIIIPQSESWTQSVDSNNCLTVIRASRLTLDLRFLTCDMGETGAYSHAPTMGILLLWEMLARAT